MTSNLSPSSSSEILLAPSAPPPAPRAESEGTSQQTEANVGPQPQPVPQPPSQQQGPYAYPGYGYGYPPAGYPLQQYPPQQYPQYAPAYAVPPGYGYPQAYPPQPVAVADPQKTPSPDQNLDALRVLAARRVLARRYQLAYTTNFVRSMFVTALVSVILAAVMLGATGWYRATPQPGVDVKMGLFSVCVTVGGASECAQVCESGNSSTACEKIRALRAAVIAGLAFLAVYTLLRFMFTCFGGMTLPPKGRRLFQLAASIGSLVCFIVSIVIAGVLLKKDLPDYIPYYCFFICIGNIVLTLSFVINDFRLALME